ncbi:uncharacterized protein N7482_007183 [Penicillium canariense]|uniref:Uncharacterized protein n=1 Tax=Penicillium canariense TaxID=189055 RepID=A0A9W9HXN2_9EURO|nr:uncharacterized protein N7482_007183 [Penicillium canariense]KAJ5160179.1 hypothetical protein N7482_007183 [Penicillium canariense]
MENKGAGPLRVPGFGDIPLEEELPISRRFAHGIKEWKQVPAITQRERTMVAVMNELTDRPNWDMDIFNQYTVDRWRDEILGSTPCMSEKAWEWCVAELRDKGAYLKDNGYFRVLDTGSCVCKSDTLVSQGLCAKFRSGLESVLAQHEGHRQDGVYTYVDPSLYPLVWGKSPVLTQVARQGDVVSSPKSAEERAPEHADKRVGSERVQERMSSGRHEPWHYAFQEEEYESKQAYFWSYNFQWLPSEVEFTKSASTDVRLTSYVNGLSPTHTSLYESLEKIISLSIEPWNDCLIKGQTEWEEPGTRLPNGWAPPGNSRKQRGRVPCRIITYGVEWENEAPEWTPLFETGRRSRLKTYLDKLADVEAIKQEKPPKDADKRTKMEYKLRLKEAQRRLSGLSDMEGLEPLPEPTPDQWIKAKEYLERPEPGLGAPIVLPEGWEQNARLLLSQKIRRLLQYKHPEPGSAFSYDQWKHGTHGGRAVVDMVTDRPINPNATPLRTPHEPYTVCLQDEFQCQGLQVITRIQGVSLSPENPEYAGSTWELAGQKNEHIVAIAILAYDVHNVTKSHMSFRQETEVGEGFFHYGPYLYQDKQNRNRYKEPAHRIYKWGEVEAISEVFGFDPYQMCGDHHDFALPMLDIGKVALPQGRLLTFPNIMESRREPFRLEDPTQPGHHRWVTLMLVDPNYRICSTRNVPPQQADWKEKDGEGKGNERCFRKEEAEDHRREMEKERAWMQYARYDRMGTFFFC